MHADANFIFPRKGTVRSLPKKEGCKVSLAKDQQGSSSSFQFLISIKFLNHLKFITGKEEEESFLCWTNSVSTARTGHETLSLKSADYIGTHQIF